MSKSSKAPPAPQPAAEKKPGLLSSPDLWIKIFIALQMILLMAQFSPDISTNGDDAVYYILGKSIATGQGYRNIHVCTAPLNTQFPPVFPVFLAATHLITDKPLTAKVLVMALGCLSALLAYFLVKRWVPPIALPLLVMTAGSWVLNRHALELLSEMPYVFLTILSLLLLEKSIRAPERKWLFIAAILVSALPINCRSVGIAFSAAIVLECLLSKRYRYALSHLGVVIASIVLFKLLVGTQSAYFIQLLQKNTYDPEAGLVTLPEMITRITGNMGAYLTEILPQSALPSFLEQSRGSGALVGVLLAAVIAAGFVRNLFLPSRIASFYVLFYCGIILMWQPQWTSVRFFSGIIPFAFFLFAVGIGAIGELFSRRQKDSSAKGRKVRAWAAPLSFSRTGIWTVSILLAVFTLDNVVYQINLSAAPQAKSPDWVNFYSCADWIREHTPTDAVVVSRKPELAYLRCQRKGMIYPYSHDPEKVIAEIRKNHATYVLFDGFFWTGTTQRYLYPALAGHPEMFHLVYALRNPDTYVLEVADGR